MNKFVQQYLILPFLIFFGVLPLFFLAGCACTTVNPGHKIAVQVVKYDNSESKNVPLPSHNVRIFKQLVWQVNQQWLFNQKLDKRSSLQIKLEAQIKALNPEKQLDPREARELTKQKEELASFIQVAFKSSKNTRYYKAEFVSKIQQKIIKGTKRIEWASEFLKNPRAVSLKNPRSLNFDLFFRSNDNDQKWKINIIIKNLTVKSDGVFDIGDDFEAQVNDFQD